MTCPNHRWMQKTIPADETEFGIPKIVEFCPECLVERGYQGIETFTNVDIEQVLLNDTSEGVEYERL